MFHLLRDRTFLSCSFGLERQVAAGVAACVKGSGVRCGGSALSSRCCSVCRLCLRSSHRLEGVSLRCGCSGLCALLYFPSAYRCVPTPVELSRFEVERNGYHIIYFARIVLDAFFAEQLEAHFFGVLFLCFQYKRFAFPSVTCFAGTVLFRQILNNFSYYFHCV